MINFILRRSLQNILTFTVILTLLFLLFQAMPGDYALSILDPKMSPEARQRLREAYGLDQPLFIQYANHVKSAFTFNFGKSFTFGRPVMDIIGERIGPTVLLFGSTMILSFLLGLILGMVLAWNYGKIWEKILTFQGLLFYTAFLPWIALLILWAFSYTLHWFPLGGMVTPELWSQGDISLGAKALDILWHLTLPLLTLTLIRYSGTALVMRGSMLGELETDYVTTARAKGLSETRVVLKHVVKNAMLPMVTSFALAIPFIVSGGVITETIFSWPGLGQLLVQSTMEGDFPIVKAVFVMITIGVLVMNLVADISYGWLDPRIRYGQ